MSAHRFEFSLNSPAAERISEEVKHLALIVDLPGIDTAAKGIRIDRDRYSTLFEALNADLTMDLQLAGSTHSQALQFRDPEDLEPDAIAGQIAVVQRLRTLRRMLTSGQQADAATRELQQFLGDTRTADTGPPAEPSSEDEDSFGSLIGGKRGSGVQQPSSFVARLLEGSESSGAPDRSELVNLCDGLVNDLVNQVLSDPDFRAMERSLTGICWLTNELDLDADLRLWLLPVDLQKLFSGEGDGLADLEHALQRMVASIDDGALAAIGLDAIFETSEDIEQLALVAGLAQRLATTLICKAPAGVTSENSILELEAGYPRSSPDLIDAWQNFRNLPEAKHCAAVLPRFLLRLPYGPKGGATDLPGFSELESNPDHERFLWINPVYGLIYLLGESGENVELALENMPMPVYDDGSGDAIMPCAEAYLSESDVTALHEQGIMVFQSYRNRNAIKLSGFFSAG